MIDRKDFIAALDRGRDAIAEGADPHSAMRDLMGDVLAVVVAHFDALDARIAGLEKTRDAR